MSINLPAKPKTADERLEALARSASNITLLKYNSGNWTISDIPVSAGTRFVLYPDQVSHSWTNFSGGKVVTEISAVVAEDDDGDTELRIVKGDGRKDLGLDDELKWEFDSAGKRRDPWVYGFWPADDECRDRCRRRLQDRVGWRHERDRRAGCQLHPE
jgi:hypothetical protein